MLRLLHRQKLHFSSQQITDYVRRGKRRPKNYLQVGSKVYNFQLLSKQYYSDFDLTYQNFKHIQHTTHFHQLQCSQQNNTFTLLFPTPGSMPHPALNTSLQKLLTCGSQHYPIRNLLKQSQSRSFNSIPYCTTVNQQFIMFNFSTSLYKDFENLLSVYMDMIFNPLLREEDFKEMVWRYAFDERRKLQIKGELAEEMRENDYYEENLIYKQIMSYFFRKENLSICSPEELTRVSYLDVVKFYKEIVTVNNLVLINHGDMSADWILNKWQQTLAKKNYKTYQPIFHYETNKDFLQNNKKSLPKTIQFEHMKPQTILLISFKIPEDIPQEQRALLSILSYLLFDMPQSPFMKFNTPQTPYPSLYGFKNRYFNIGITFNDLSIQQNTQSIQQKQKIMIQKQQQIFSTLQNLISQKISNSLIQQCLIHLQANYYTQNGFTITQNIIDKILFNKSQKTLNSVFNVTSTIQRVMKKYRKENIFQKLIEKYLLNNKEYICLRGYNNYQAVENNEFQRSKILSSIQKTLSNEAIHKILSYSPPTLLQDIQKLPQIKPNQLQFFEDTEPVISSIEGVKIFYQPCLNSVSITLKSDVSDLSEDLFPFLDLFCKAFTKMGIKSFKDQAYNQMLNRYVNSINLRYQTQKDVTNEKQMKVYLFMTIDFNDRNFEYGFNIINGLLSDFNCDNIFALSKIIQKTASECFYSVSQDIVSIHGRHLAASKSPFAFFQSPIFNSRSITGMAGDLRKVTNPKQILMGIRYQLQQIWQTMTQKARLQILLECKQSKKEIYFKYLQQTVKSVSRKGQKIPGINIDNFPEQRWLKYFPNFQQQLCFQVFKFPYYQKKSSAALVYSSLINRNILNYNKVGGSFIYKGALISFLEGGRKKILQLQDYYKKLDDIDFAKRSIFQKFKRYTVKDYFQSGISIQEARFFKQAVIATEKKQIQEIMNQYILETLKKGQSSILCLGPKLQNYEPLLKKGWQIERPVDDLSLNVESYSLRQPTLKLEDYTKIW